MGELYPFRSVDNTLHTHDNGDVSKRTNLIPSRRPSSLASLEGLTEPQMEAAILIASGKNYRQTAEQIGVSGHTVWEWMRGETREVVTKLRYHMTEAVINKMAASAEEIADTLLKIARGKMQAKPKQVDAILATLGYAGLGSPKGEGRFTQLGGAGSFAGANVSVYVGYPPDQRPTGPGGEAVYIEGDERESEGE